ncbi:hypothetical protein ACG7TL_007401 [Trametes sanguinea]
MPPSSSSTLAEEAKLKVPEHSPSAYVQPIIRTLRPEALSTEDHVVFSVEQGYCFVWDALAAGQSPSSSISTSLAQNNRPFANIRYSNEHTRFPAGLQGFFYYYTYKHGAPLTSGELRFRRTSSNDPAAFSSGEDLKAAHGLPWRMLLPTLASSPTYETICRILRRDGLVDEETLRVAARMGSSRARRTEQISLIHSLRQPFYLDFASPIHWWHIMGRDTIYFARPMSNVLAPKLEGHRFPSPWLGVPLPCSAICAFVPSKHPSHKERRILNIIVLSIVEPPTPNPAFPSYLLPDISQTPPRVGDMLRRGRSPWALDVDSCSMLANLDAWFLLALEKAPNNLSDIMISHDRGARWNAWPADFKRTPADLVWLILGLVVHPNLTPSKPPWYLVVMAPRNSSDESYIEASEPQLLATTGGPPSKTESDSASDPGLVPLSKTVYHVPEDDNLSHPSRWRDTLPGSVSKESSIDSFQEHASLSSIPLASFPARSYSESIGSINLPTEGSVALASSRFQLPEREGSVEAVSCSNDPEGPSVHSEAPQVTHKHAIAHSDQPESRGLLPNADDVRVEVGAPAESDQTSIVDDQVGSSVLHSMAGPSVSLSLEPHLDDSIGAVPNGRNTPPTSASLSRAAIHAWPLNPAPGPAADIRDDALLLPPADLEPPVIDRPSSHSHDQVIANVPQIASSLSDHQPTSGLASPVGLPGNSVPAARGQHTLVPPHSPSFDYANPTVLGRAAHANALVTTHEPNDINPGLYAIKQRVKDAVLAILGAADPLVEEFLELAVNVGAFVPFIPLREAAEALLRIWNAVKLVKTNQHACLRLTDRCATFLISIREAVAGAQYNLGIELRAPIARLVAAFDRIHGVVLKHVELPFIKRLIHQKDIQAALLECQDDLQDALTMFGFNVQFLIAQQVMNSQRPAPPLSCPQTRVRSASTASSNGPMPSSERPANVEGILAELGAVAARQLASDFARDAADLRRLLRGALEAHDDREMLRILQVGQREMPEAIITLQRAIASSSLGTSHLDLYDGNTGVVVSGTPDRRDAPRDIVSAGSTTASEHDVEKEFMVAGISLLKRMSANVILPSWTITRFELYQGRLIGTGGWANVFEGKWNGHVVAIKVLVAATPRELFHKEDVVHGDLKGVNVLVNDKGHCVISDFGQSEMKLEWYNSLVGLLNGCWQQDPSIRPDFSKVDQEVQELRAQAKHGITAPNIVSDSQLKFSVSEPTASKLTDLRTAAQARSVAGFETKSIPCFAIKSVALGSTTRICTILIHAKVFWPWAAVLLDMWLHLWMTMQYAQ